MKRDVFATERRLDNNNRVVIPADFRFALGWSSGTVIYIMFRALRKEIVLMAHLMDSHELPGERYMRRLDDLGRFCVPIKFRTRMELPTGGVVRIECDVSSKEIRLTTPVKKVE